MFLKFINFTTLPPDYCGILPVLLNIPQSKSIICTLTLRCPAGPMFGQLNHFVKFAPEKVPYAINRYTTEAKRLLKVLDTRLEGRQYLAGDDYTIADISTFTWVNTLFKGHADNEQLGLAEFKNVKAWLDRCLARPAVEVSSRSATCLINMCFRG